MSRLFCNSMTPNYRDTAGREDHDRLRPLSYPQTSVFIVCFSITSMSSFENIEATWIPELRHHMPGVPVVIVGTKSDLRDDMETMEYLAAKGQRYVTTQDAQNMACRVGASAYVECSALSGENMDKIPDVYRIGLAFERENSFAKRNKGVVKWLTGKLMELTGNLMKTNAKWTFRGQSIYIVTPTDCCI
uniref:Uncharacterized protein n=1 Tax=Octactis speculum TaxID=3111310 RepID=A0A7S2MSH3_9STRA|mmetsp:Transcript_9226/g.11886  ORF Transcript_9226/g.11886 Transcript_9226/m.11886 type:complete len:189 (+) Transcript_9226:261-827(+)